MKPCVHFIGLTAAETVRAERVWGKPDFVHPRFDSAARGHIDFDIDTVVTRKEIAP